jgi:hypothetical protein
VKDDLKGFHAALAVQANSQQVVAYDLMLKSTESALAEARGFLEQAAKANAASELAAHDKTLQDAIENARNQNKKFLDGLGERQKSGLKETVKKLGKADADVAQQAKAVDLVVEEAKAAGPQVAGVGQNLEHALTSFQQQQLGLGDEMSVGAANKVQDVAFNIPPVSNTVRFANQPITVTTSGVISKSTLQSEPNTYELKLTTDMSDLRDNITEVLRRQLDKADRCGEQIETRSATLTPASPAILVVVKLHYERWACLGRGTPNEMLEGNGTIEVKLTPAVGGDGTLHLAPAIGRVEAEELVRELLQSGSLGEGVRDKVAEAILSIMQQSSDYKTTLPATAQGNVMLQRAEFESAGLGKLSVVLEGEIQLSGGETSSFAAGLKESETKGQPPAPQATPR